MQYLSSRGNSPKVTAAQAIINGIAPDGGLYIPERIPRLGKDDFINGIDLSYHAWARMIMHLYLPEFSTVDLDNCAQSAYNAQSFDNGEVAPLRELASNVHIMELWHGPTKAFKDVALQILPHLLTASLKKTGENKKMLILVATSGDTGKAALEGFKDVEGTRVVVFYPAEGVSQVQRLQMITQAGGNVQVIGVKGNFDDAQNGVKEIFGNKDFISQLTRQGFKMSSANSINWGRLLPQIVYYIFSYVQLMRKGKIQFGDQVNIVVPSGNFGNILAAFYAREMGLPIGRLICAANANKVLTDFINSGVYDRNRIFYKTISPSMDILVSSNLERLLAEISGRDFSLVNKWIKGLISDGRYQVSEAVREKMQDVFWSDFADGDETEEAIFKTWGRYQYLVDPHTAVALHVYNRYLEETGDSRNTIVVSTASPFKFGSSVARALLPEDILVGQDEFSMIDSLSAWTGVKIPGCLLGLNERPILHSTVADPADMQKVVASFLGSF